MPEWKDKGIILSAKKYGEKGLILNILTENQGRHLGKQTAANDVICAVEFLIQEKFTSSELLGVHGVGCGGLVSAICVNQRPELFKAME